MEANKILSAQLIDLVFDDRNKEYGAYYLRKTYSRRIKRALLVTLAISSLAFGGAVLANSAKKSKGHFKTGPVVQLTEVKEKPPEKLPDPIKKPEPVPMKTEIFTSPKIVDKEVLDTPPPTLDDLADAKIDLFKQDGVIADNIATPEKIDAGMGIIAAKNETEPEGPYTKVEIDAKFIGNWKSFLERNLNGSVATDNSAPVGRYSVVIRFVVDKEGNVSDIEALTNHGYGLEAEAIRVIKKATKWEPAIQNGTKVKAYRKQVIIFDVLDEG